MANGMSGKSANALGLVAVAALVGAAVALLFAPKSGEELRSDIRNKAKSAKDTATDKLEETGEAVSEAKDAAVDKASKARDRMSSGQ